MRTKDISSSVSLRFASFSTDVRDEISRLLKSQMKPSDIRKVMLAEYGVGNRRSLVNSILSEML